MLAQKLEIEALSIGLRYVDVSRPMYKPLHCCIGSGLEFIVPEVSTMMDAILNSSSRLPHYVALHWLAN